MKEHYITNNFKFLKIKKKYSRLAEMLFKKSGV